MASGSRGTRLLAALATVAGAACGDQGPSAPATPPVVITTAGVLPAATVGMPYEQVLSATGGTGVVSWRVFAGALPAGVSLSATGVLGGTPTVVESRSFTVRASSGSHVATAELALAVEHPPLLITTASLVPAILGASYAQFLDVEAGEGQATWSLASGALPPGIALSVAGVLTGNATALGRFDFRVRVVRGVRSGERSLALTVNPPPLAITTASLPEAETGLGYEVQLESSGGVGGNAWTLVSGRLPEGLALGTGGTITGTPAREETQTFSVQLSSGTQRVTRGLALAVGPPSYVSAAVVDMPADVFTPFLVKLNAGGTVTWRFPSRPHNVIFVPAPGAPADINIVSNVDVTRRFDSPGLFRYDCTIHPGMGGQVAVR